jgi:endonuclease YncB( thermonuclease family)
LTVSNRRHDDYGRLLARIDLRGDDVGRWMVINGHAWSDRYGRQPGPYAAEQSQAQLGQRGLFAGSAAELPRSFRKRHGSCYA